jgi:hypothetical protein
VTLPSFASAMRWQQHKELHEHLGLLPSIFGRDCRVPRTESALASDQTLPLLSTMHIAHDRSDTSNPT